MIEQLAYYREERVQTQLAASYAITNDGFKYVSEFKANALDRSIILLVFAIFWSGIILALPDVVKDHDRHFVAPVPAEVEVVVE